MKIIKKAWGECRRILESPEMIFDRIEFRSGCSSLHLHWRMWNRILVRQGRLALSLLNTGGFYSYMELGPNSLVEIPPFAKHRFAVIEPGVAWEIYLPDDGETCSVDDICRFDEGSEILPNEQYLPDGIAAKMRLVHGIFGPRSESESCQAGSRRNARSNCSSG